MKEIQLSRQNMQLLHTGRKIVTGIAVSFEPEMKWFHLNYSKHVCNNEGIQFFLKRMSRTMQDG
jgi:hypothetical protein